MPWAAAAHQGRAVLSARAGGRNTLAQWPQESGRFPAQHRHAHLGPHTHLTASPGTHEIPQGLVAGLITKCAPRIFTGRLLCARLLAQGHLPSRRWPGDFWLETNPPNPDGGKWRLRVVWGRLCTVRPGRLVSEPDSRGTWRVGDGRSHQYCLQAHAWQMTMAAGWLGSVWHLHSLGGSRRLSTATGSQRRHPRELGGVPGISVRPAGCRWARCASGLPKSEGRAQMVPAVVASLAPSE